MNASGETRKGFPLTLPLPCDMRGCEQQDLRAVTKEEDTKRYLPLLLFCRRGVEVYTPLRGKSPTRHQVRKPRKHNVSPVFLLFSTLSGFYPFALILRQLRLICKNHKKITYGLHMKFARQAFSTACVHCLHITGTPMKLLATTVPPAYPRIPAAAPAAAYR